VEVDTSVLDEHALSCIRVRAELCEEAGRLYRQVASENYELEEQRYVIA
jgi:hypothetical protein